VRNRKNNRNVNLNQVQPQTKPPIVAGQLNIQHGVSFSPNSGTPGFVNQQQWRLQPHFVHPNVGATIPSPNPALNPQHFYTTQKPATPNQQHVNNKTDNRNQSVANSQSVTPNNQPIQGQLFIGQPMRNSHLNLGFDLPTNMSPQMGIAYGQAQMGQTMVQHLRQFPGDPRQGVVTPQIKVPEQPSQPSHPTNQTNDQLNEKSGKGNVSKSSNSAKSKSSTEGDNQPVAFGQHSMTNMRQGSGLVPQPMQPRRVNNPSYLQYVWSGVPGQFMGQQNLIPRPVTQHAYSVNANIPPYCFPSVNANMQLIPNQAFIAVPNPVNQKVNIPQQPEVRVPKTPVMSPPTDQTAAKEMRQKFEAAAGTNTSPVTPRPQPSKPPNTIVKIHLPTVPVPEEDTKPSSNSNRGLNPNATTFVPCTPNGTTVDFKVPTEATAFDPTTVAPPAPIPPKLTPPIPPKVTQKPSPKLKPPLVLSESASNQSLKTDVLKQAWLGVKTTAKPDGLQEEVEPVPKDEKMGRKLEAAPSLEDSLTGSPRKPTPTNIIAVDKEEKEEEEDEEQREEECKETQGELSSPKSQGNVLETSLTKKESTEVDKTVNVDQKPSDGIVTLQRLKLTGKQMSFPNAIKYPMKDIVKLQGVAEFGDLPDEIDNSKESRAHFRAFQGPSSRVALLMKDLFSSEAQNNRVGRQSQVYSVSRPSSTRQRSQHQRPGGTMRTGHQNNQRQQDDGGVTLDRNNMGVKKVRPRRGPQTPRAPMYKPLPPTSGSAYVPNVGVHQRDVEHDEMVRRRVRSFLNKVAPDKFESVCAKLISFCETNITDYSQLGVIAKLVFKKSCQEPKYSHLYATLCDKLSKSLQLHTSESATTSQEGSDQKDEKTDQPSKKSSEKNTKNPFRRALLSECQTMFDKGTVLEEHGGDKKVIGEGELLEKRTKAKQKVIGNMKFIGELFKLKLIHERIVHRCIQNLLTSQAAVTQKKMEQTSTATIPISKMDLEAAVNLLKSTGKELDRQKAESWVNQYFNYLRFHANRMQDKRIMFMVVNLEDLRKNKWESKKEENKVKTKAEIKEEHLKKLVDSKNASSSRRNRDIQTPRRRTTPQNRNRTAGRNRNTGSTRRLLQHNSGTGKAWSTVLDTSSNINPSQDVRSQQSKRGAALSKKIPRTSPTESPRPTHYRPPSLSYNKQHGNENAYHPEPTPVTKDLKALWFTVKETLMNPIDSEEMSEPNRIRNDAIRDILLSTIKPTDLIQECMSKCFNNNDETQCSELAKLINTLLERRYIDKDNFWHAVRDYVRTFEHNIVDCPNMALFTVELLNRCVKDKQEVMTYIERILEIMETPEDEHSWDLSRYLGRALLEFMDEPKIERKALIVELSKRDLKKFFRFKPHQKYDGPNKDGYYNAKRFLMRKEKWLEIAGF